MTGRAKRKNETLLRWLGMAAITAATYVGLLGMDFRPGWGAAALALAAGALGYLSIDLGVLVAVLALGLPLVAANPVVGLLFIVLGVVGIRYLGADGGAVFFVVAASIAGAFLGPVWAGAALAGLLLGTGEGALAAAISCLAVEALGVSLGRATINATITGGTSPLVSFTNAPANMFSGGWISETFATVGTDSVNGFVATIAATRFPAALLVQIGLWSLAAVATSLIAREARRRRNRFLVVAAPGIGAVVPALGMLLYPAVAGPEVALTATAIAAVTSAAVAMAVAVLWERAFPLLPKPAAAPAAAGASTLSMAAEDADVDELLRLISTAEDKLTADHTTNKVVMITDMKSFSRMTEEDGSMLTAKAIQRHRDLLLPLIEARGGHGKSTGGDGLVAAFESASEAMLAAAEMQQALTRFNDEHPDEREMTVRIGIADGEVVLDKGGRPFIGAALNLAARVMNLADGGQAFVTGSLSRQADDVVATHSHGEFELKNIAKPVEVVEIVWSTDLEPVDPRSRGLS